MRGSWDHGFVGSSSNIWWRNAICLGTPRRATATPWRSCCRLPANTAGHAIDRMTVEDLTPSMVRKFLDHLEHDRQCSGVTRNQRLATIRSLARFIGIRSPAHVAWCAQIRATPLKKTAKTVIGYLEKAEMDALLAQPDRRTPLGNRDHALLLFLYNSGARADEAAKLTIDKPAARLTIVRASTRQRKQVPDLSVMAGHRGVAIAVGRQPGQERRGLLQSDQPAIDSVRNPQACHEL